MVRPWLNGLRRRLTRSQLPRKPRHCNPLSLEVLETRLAPTIQTVSLADPALIADTAGGASVNAHVAGGSGGRYVVFESNARNLVPGVSNFFTHIYRRDTLTGTTVLVDTSADGTVANNNSEIPWISDDGSRVAFISAAGNLVAGGTGVSNEIFVKDLNTGVVFLASATSGGVQANRDCGSPVISGDGTRVAFVSSASNLVSGVAGNTNEVFVKDLGTGAVFLASGDASDNPANANVSNPALSIDGNRVVFQTTATNLVTGAGGTNAEVFVKDLGTDAVVLASADAGGNPANNSATNPSISGDGINVAFQTAATNLVSGAGGSNSQIFVKDLGTSAVTVVSTDATGTLGNFSSISPVLSAGGAHVAFLSNSTNFAAGTSQFVNHLYVKDLGTGALGLEDTTAAGTVANANPANPSISGDGNYVAFESLLATNLVDNDFNGNSDTFLKSVGSGAISLISRRDPGLPVLTANAGAGTSHDYRQVSADGRYVVFTGGANLVFGDSGAHVFRRDLLTGTTVPVDTTAAGVPANVPSADPVISADGSRVAFETRATNLAPGLTGSVPRIFVKDLTTGALYLASSDANGTPANSGANSPAISGDGTRVVFATPSTNLVAGAGGSLSQAFVKDLTTGAVYLASADSSGNPANNNVANPTINDDGTRVAFQTPANNLVSGVGGASPQIFVKDLDTGAVFLASCTAAGTPGNIASTFPKISGDGNRVVFESNSTNLGTTALGTKLYVKDLTTGAIVLASSNASGQTSNADALSPSINEDGTRVAFTSSATNLVAGTSGQQVFLKDLNTGAVTLISAAPDGAQANNGATDTSLSLDGNHVVFASVATNLDPSVPDNSGNVFNVYLVTVGSVSTAPLTYDASANPSIAAYTLQKNGDSLEVVETANPGDVLASQPLANTSAIAITGNPGGGDTLTIDYGFGGLFYVVGGVTFNGGAGSGALLVTNGSSAETGTYRPDATTAGAGAFFVNGNTITFSNVAAIDASALATVNLLVTNGNDAVNVADGVAAVDGVTPALSFTGSLNGVVLAPLNLYNDGPANLIVNGVAGGDMVTINSDTLGAVADLTIATTLGSDAANVTGAVSLTGNLAITSAQINLNPTAAITTGGTQTYTGATNLLADTVITSTGAGAGGNIAFTGGASGPGGLTVSTAGTAQFIGIFAMGSLTTNGPGVTAFRNVGTRITTTSAQTYNNAVTVTIDTITFATTGPAGNITFGSTLDGTIFPSAVNIITNDPAAVITIAGDIGDTAPLGLLHITDAGADTISGQVNGVTGLTKDGPGTLWLMAANGFTGAVNVNNGTLVFDGSLGASSNPVTVNNGGTLAGNGTLNRPLIVNNGGTVAPGDPLSGPGILHTGTGGDATLNSGSIFFVGLNPASIGSIPVAGVDYSQLDVAGTLTLNGATLAGTSGTISTGTPFSIIHDQSPVAGTFAGADEGSSLTIGGATYSITYLGGDGDDIMLTAQ
jgi:autotransporter-associated beta strand protein